MPRPHSRYLTLLLLALSLLTAPLTAQDVENSYLLPNKGIVNVLLVFAEKVPAPANKDCWAGVGVLPSGVPANADEWLDPSPTATPQGYITDYYAQASFGEYQVLGDYLDTTIKYPAGSGDPTNYVVNHIASLPNFTTRHGLKKADFDRWTLTSPGQPKINAPNGKIDVLVIVWRNNDQWTYCGEGYGVQAWGSPHFDAVGSFNSADGGFFLQEYFHALYGGNHWHTGGGAGAHSTLALSKAISSTGQAGSPSQLASAWDRQQMGWLAPGRTASWTATDESCGADIESDLDIATHPTGGDFCLRDFNTTGDALRIKLPHLDWSPPLQPVKNQYLILENRRLHTSQAVVQHRFDVYAGHAGSDPCEEKGAPGIYAYYQIGKDVKQGPAIYTSDFAHPNGLGSWLYAFEAEGRWDSVYRIDLTQPGAWIGCNWNNVNVPKDPWNARTLPNPFTGMSDLAAAVDTNQDGVLHQGDNPFISLSEVQRDGKVKHNWVGHGDADDAFRLGYRSKIGIGTNPAPVPVYTYTQQPYNLTSAGKPKPYENRRIHLNGLSVQILAERPDGSVIVRVRWDDYLLAGDVRWTGDIVLRNDPDDPLKRPSRIHLSGTRILDLDQGLSPTQHKAVRSLPDGSHLFAQPTILTLESGTVTQLIGSAQMLVRNGSTLHVKAGAELRLIGLGSVTVHGGSYLCIEPGAKVVLNGAETRLRLNAGSAIGVNPALGLPAPVCQSAAAIAVAGTGKVVAPHGCADPQKKLKPVTRALYRFNETLSQPAAQDLACSSNAVKVGGAMPCPGIVGGALCFDGLTGHARTPSTSSRLNVGAGDFSIAAWIRSNDATGVRVILDKRTADPYRGYSLHLVEGRLGLQMANGTGDEFTTWNTNASIADGKWHHVVVTVDRDHPQGGRFYVDCGLTAVGSALWFNPTGRKGSLDNDSPLYLGRRSALLASESGGYWSGALDELSLFNKALSQAEVNALCHSAGVGRCF